MSQVGKARWGRHVSLHLSVHPDVGSDLPGRPFSAKKVPESRALCLVGKLLADGLCEGVWEMCCKT